MTQLPSHKHRHPAQTSLRQKGPARVPSPSLTVCLLDYKTSSLLVMIQMELGSKYWIPNLHNTCVWNNTTSACRAVETHAELKYFDVLLLYPESFDRCMNVNTRGTFFLTQEFARRLRDSVTPCHRSIVTITSANAKAVSITRGEYCISKAGASMMSKLFASRLSDEDIGVYEIQPGIIETDMTAPAKVKYDKLIEEGLTVNKRFGTPQDVARIAVTMARGLLPYTVGQAILVDGGLMTVRY